VKQPPDIREIEIGILLDTVELASIIYENGPVCRIIQQSSSVQTNLFAPAMNSLPFSSLWKFSPGLVLFPSCFLIARAEMARLLCAIVVRFECLIRSVCEASRDSLNLWRKAEQLVNIDDRIFPPNCKERPIMEPGMTVTSVDKTLDLRGGKRTLNAESTISEKPHKKRFFAL
jgi:hypothetical protein